MRLSHDAPSKTYFAWLDGEPGHQVSFREADVLDALAERGTTNSADDHAHVREQVAREIAFGRLTT